MLWIFRSTSTFQSTPSAWRETFLALHSLMLAAKFQSTPSAWRETPPVWQILLPVSISIHSLRMEGDEAAMCQLAHRNYFNPLPPHGGRPYCTYQPAWLSRHFNPLPPHGGRRGEVMYSIKRGTFQSTPSAWRETAKLHRKAFFISPILVQSCKKGCKRLHSAPEKMVFFEKREKNLVRNLQHLSVRL